ncbi:MAG: Rieske 2Fe-2S domain-containing protein [Maritimibacter sp.]|nr:Rieske 2Fe-2S domain-containing protein [Maritimibacter sp.]
MTSTDLGTETKTIATALCRFEELVDGASRGFDPLGEGRDTMFVVRRGPRVFGWRNLCPHYDHARMAWKKDEYLTGDRKRIICGAHGAQFEIATGVCVIGPCLGRSLTPVPLTLRCGGVYITEPYAPGLRRRAGAHHD